MGQPLRPALHQFAIGVDRQHVMAQSDQGFGHRAAEPAEADHRHAVAFGNDGVSQ